MRFPTKKRLKAAFPSLTDEKIALMRKLVALVDKPDELAALIEEKCESTHAYARKCYSDPYDSGMWRRTMVLHALDVIMETYGVEPLGEVDMREGPPYEYLNQGDPYVATIIYNVRADAAYIGRWGDLVETGKVA